MKTVGIITFHNSYNCGSMLETYAMQESVKIVNSRPIIINFSSNGQKELYAPRYKFNSLKNIVKNILLFGHVNKIKYNNKCYEDFKNKYFILTEPYGDDDLISDANYDVVIAGSDQIWNITIADSSDFYFLNWCKKAKKVAYAPSFGSKNILRYSKKPDKYIKYLTDFDCISIRENNGKKWIRDMISKDVPVVLDPTLLLNVNDYDKLVDNSCLPDGDYIFFYCPSFDQDICKFVKQVSKKYNIPVIAWSTKNYYIKLIGRFGFKLPKYESPSVYLSFIKNARLIFTTSFHGTIFSSLYHKKYFTLKNGGMYGDDDRVITLMDNLGLNERLIEYKFDENFDYLKDFDFDKFEENREKLKKQSYNYLEESIKDEKSK